MEGMSARQLHELVGYYDIEPFGEFRQELRHGQQMALTANTNRDPKARLEPFRAKEFMNFLEAEPEKIYTVEELEAYASKIFG